MLGTCADIAGIVSLLLTIILLIRSEKLRNELISQKINYRSQQAQISERISNLISILINNESLSLKTVSDIRQELYQYNLTFQHLLSRKDKEIISQAIKLLEEDYSEDLKKRLIDKLNYLAARFSKQEV